MMLVSLSTFAQYPMIKKINGKEVVIMTVSQAEAINNKFQLLEDSIATLNNNYNGAVTSLNFTQNKVEVLTDSINHAQDSIIKTNTLYKQEVKRIDGLQLVDKRTRMQVKFGLIIVAVTWIFGILTSK